jgi:hypothetical protein
VDQSEFVNAGKKMNHEVTKNTKRFPIPLMPRAGLDFILDVSRKNRLTCGKCSEARRRFVVLVAWWFLPPFPGNWKFSAILKTPFAAAPSAR